MIAFGASAPVPVQASGQAALSAEDPHQINFIVRQSERAFDALQKKDTAAVQRIIQEFSNRKINPGDLFRIGMHFYRGGEDAARNLRFARKPRVASKLFFISAMGGNVEAQLMLASLFFKGKVLEKNLVQAYVWSTIAQRNPGLNPEMASYPDRIIHRAEQSMTPAQLTQARRLLKK
ncbi:MAG: hypothetical protein GWO19_10140 [Nitrospinaceae bacterium]|nr:hypothetical protein [Nitrospinaceae bacterium]NIS85337.1 hypothetical protein [Nitrospinaceae bacterium]NIU44407.1 hypothetical protein [Nitrospinaceae bacterium]NIU96541.1 hypothetical protein [Nitrospinaceae bacterium]NIW59172.1 hypothetical protein [Nitrospinaceae bacterium]